MAARTACGTTPTSSTATWMKRAGEGRHGNGLRRALGSTPLTMGHSTTERGVNAQHQASAAGPTMRQRGPYIADSLQATRFVCRSRGQRRAMTRLTASAVDSDRPSGEQAPRGRRADRLGRQGRHRVDPVDQAGRRLAAGLVDDPLRRAGQRRGRRSRSPLSAASEAASCKRSGERRDVLCCEGQARGRGDWPRRPRRAGRRSSARWMSTDVALR